MRRAGGLLLLALVGAAQAGSYRVQPGDTLWSVARRSGTTVAALLTLNGRSSPVIRIGETLQVPDAAVPALPVARSVPAAATRGAATVRAASLAPSAAGTPVFQTGQAVYYGGRRDTRTSLTAAHLSLPFGTWVRVTHARTGRSVDVLINDRGPFGVPSRVIDLSAEAAAALGILGEGVAPVSLSVLSRP